MSSNHAELVLEQTEKRANLVLRAAKTVAGAVGRGVGRAGQNAPITTALGAAGTIALAPSLMKGDPAAKQEAIQNAMRRKQLAANAGGYMKRASVLFSEDDVRRALSIRRGLEKSAASKATVEQILSKSLPGLFAAGAVFAAGAGAAGAAGAASSFAVGKGTEAVRAKGQTKRFNDMIRADKTLRGEKAARGFFNVLDKASPYISSEPHVAAATVRSMLEAPEGYALHPKYMKDILGVEESRQKTRFPVLRGPTFKAEMPGMGG